MSIKIDRARKLSVIGDCHGSFSAMLDHIAPETIESVSSRTLAEIIDSLWRCAGQSKTIAIADAITEGCLWDAKRGRSIELAA